MTDYLPVAVRGYMAPTPAEPKARCEPTHAAAPVEGPVLIFDIETTTDLTQALQFGAYRYCRQEPDGTLRTVQEGLFYAEELPVHDPDGYARLVDFAARATPSVDQAFHDSTRTLVLLSRREFLDQVLWPAMVRSRGTVVGFSLPFDLSRLAVHASAGRKGNGSISLRLWDHDGSEHQYRPRISIRSIDAQRTLIQLTATNPRDPDNPLVNRDEAGEPLEDPKARHFRGNFLDLRTLVYALTDTSHTLATACEAFHVTTGKTAAAGHGEISADYIDYCRRDVTATTELYQAALAEYRTHPIDLPATAAYSSASIAKGYLRAMNITPPLTKHTNLDPQLLGATVSAFYGGRTECRIRKTPVPVTVLDFTAMYPTVNALLRTWKLLTADTITTQDVTDEIRALLAGMTLEQAFNPALWPRLIGVAQIEPDGDVLPVRAKYGTNGEWVIGYNPVHQGPLKHTLWYSFADLVASTLLTRKPPKILRAIRYTPHGTDPDLHTTHLQGHIEVNPLVHDFFARTIEQRQHARTATDPDAARRAAFLKVLANAGSYGIFAQVNRTDQPAKKRIQRTIHGATDTYTLRPDATEEPGDYYFPPIATAITGGARLMLALLERLVTDVGGVWAFADTDSMAIVHTPNGQLVPCPNGPHQLPDGTPAVRSLSDTQLDTIQAAFNRLNPYDRTAVPGSILKREHTATCYSISSKRYALYDTHPDGSIAHIVKASEHGLGHLLNPTDPENTDRAWIEQAWTWLIHRDQGHPVAEPHWLDRPAVSRTTVSSPTSLRTFNNGTLGRSYAEQVKPYNFISVAFPNPLRLPAGINPLRFRLIAPYNTDPSAWTSAAWSNPYSPTAGTYTITTAADDGTVRPPGTIAVKTYRDALTAYSSHPEAKANAADRFACARQSRGLLTCRPTGIATVTHIGKEAHGLEAAQAGLTADPLDVTATYGSASDQVLSMALTVLAGISTSQLAAVTGISIRRLQDVRAGRSAPRDGLRRQLIDAASMISDGAVLGSGEALPRFGLVVHDSSLAARLMSPDSNAA